MEIKMINENKKQFWDLLLLADEQESMIDKYLAHGELFALYDDGLKSICVVTQENNDVCELKNIATYEEWHGHGYGSRLLQHISSYYQGRYGTLLVGTGDVPWILNFYQKNGFYISHRIENFFTDNYNHPIYDDGILLTDMIYLSKALK